MNRKTAEYGLVAAGVLVTALGIVVLMGWATHTQTLVRLISTSTEMRRNTALGLAVCGLGMILLTMGRRLPALLAGAFCALQGFLTALEWEFGLNFGIDDLLGKSFFPGQSQPCGRMSPITALCFMLGGFAILSWGWKAGRRFRSWITGILASVLAAIGSVTSMGYILGNTHAYGWSDLTRIAFNTALAFALVGISLLIFVLSQASEPESAATAPSGWRPPEWLPLSAGIGVLTATLGVWQALMAKSPEEQPLLSEIVLAAGVILSLLLALVIHVTQREKGSPEITMLAGFGLAFATLVAVGIVQHRNIQALVEMDRWVEHTRAVRTELESVYSAVQQGESGTRGYVVTGLPDYIAQQQAGISRSEEHLRAVRSLTADNPSQQRNVDKLELLAGRKTAMMHYLTGLRRDQGVAAASRYLATEEPLRLMNEIRTVVDTMEAEEYGLFDRRQAASRASARDSTAAVVFGTLLALAFVLAAGWITRRDALKRTHAEEKLRRVNRALKTISECNQAMVQAQEEKALLLQICSILAQEGGYRLAWVGYAEQDAARTVRPVAQAGSDEDYVANARISWGDNERGRGPTGKAIRLAGTFVARQTSTEAEYEPWRAAAAQHGFASSIALPLSVNSHPIGALTLYSVLPDAFDEDELKLLAELANDLAFGIHALRTRAKHQRAEEALRQSEADFRTLTDAMPQMVWMCLPDGMNVYFNDRWVEYTGLTLEESYGRGWNTPFHPDDKQAAWDAWNHATATGDTYRIESRLRRADGGYRWFLMRGMPLRDAAGQIVKWFGTCTDIHDLKEGEESLRKATEALARANSYNRSLLEASLDPLVTIAPDGKLTDVNNAAEKVTGLSREELIGADFSDFFTDPEKAQAGYQQVFREGLVQDYELEVRHRDGRTTPVLYNASLYRDEAGEVVGVFAAARDINEQKQAQDALRRAGAYNRSLLEASLDPLVTIAPDGKITDVNAATENVTGQSREELIGTDFSDYFTDPERARAGYQQVFKEGLVQDYELEVLQRDGHTTPVLYNASLYRDERGEVAGVFAAARDITERKRVQELVAAERQRLNSILDVMPAYVVLLTPDYHVPFANRYFEERFGKSHGKRCFEYLFGRTSPCEVCHSFEPFQTHAPVQWYWTGPDGRDYDIHDFPFTDTDGSNMILEMGIDITEQKRAEQDLRENKRRLDLAQKAGRVGTWDWTFSIGKVIWTPETEALYGLPPDGFEGQYENWRRAVHPDDLERTERDISHAVESNTSFESEFRVVWPDGSLHWLAGRGDVIYDDAGKPSRMIGVNVDITDRKRAEEEIRELNASLERRVAQRTAELAAANQELEAFTYSVAHDLRSPLRGMDGFSLALMDDYGPKLDEQAQKYLQRIRAASVRMGLLIDDLLKLSRISRAEVRRERVDLSALALAVATDLQKSNPEQRAELVIQPGLKAEGDPHLLEVVLQNLLGNAWKFSAHRQPARIEFGAAVDTTPASGHPSSPEEGNRRVYFVRDNGAGFDMAYVDKLFAPFQRLHAASEFPGTGIGLVTVARIVRKHGGEVWAEGAVGQGATFSFTLGGE